MIRSLCCCFFSDDSSSNERQPLLNSRPSEVNGAESARQARAAHKDAQTVKRIGRLVMRRVGVQELDRRFSDMAETFNEQQECYEAMVQHIRNLQQTWGCTRDDSLALAECVDKMRKEQEGSFIVYLKMKGYDFSLSVDPVRSSEGKAPPPALRLAQNELKGASESAKATISKSTTLLELIGWLLRCQDQMAEQLNEAAPTYQERGRLKENLEENMREVRRAKELSQGYRQQAGDILTEAAQIAGAHI
ncbi:uncharacterized protein si:ch73-345f18.3 [Mugil cephalus]|uniref:uncharacterized protein si:ch73-345f18.3 n=1 Tax=Mugil cephalus TaxID=48193 RepID=UPI001FB747C2|nr:uncharacterized protein si:ch73-345f18.3 [Mugil cephalus]